MSRLLAPMAALALASACVAPPHAPPAASMNASPAGSAAQSLPPGFPLGVWTNYVTEEDLRAAGYTDPALLDENVGTQTMTLRRDGTWTMAVESSQPMRWPVFHGTFEVTGPNALRKRTTFPPEMAGEVLDFEWTYEDDGLRFRAIDPYDPIIHVQYESHLWQPED